MIGPDRAEVEPALARTQQRRIGPEENLTHRMRGAVVQPARHAVPERAEMLGIAAADVLAAAEVLRRTELLEDVIVVEAGERPLVVDRRVRDHAWLVNAEVLEGIVDLAIGDH